MKFVKKSFGVITGLIAFSVYMFTVSRSVAGSDSGELATVQAILGIAHPPGYPLFTILGYLFLKIPLGLREIYQLNILCSIWCAAAVTFFTYAAKLILDNLDHLKTYNTSKLSNKIDELLNRKTSDAEMLKYLVAMISGLFLAFSLIVWLQSASVEVYSLQFFLFSVIIYFFFREYFKPDKGNSLSFNNNKGWILLGFLLGLGFSNHLMTFYLLPAFLFLYFSKYKFNRRSILRLTMIAAITIIVTLCLYSYLIIRAGQQPEINWSNPDTIVKAFDHISAKYYEGYLFASFDAFTRQVKFLYNSFGFYQNKLFAGDYNINLIFCLSGLILSFIAFRRFFYFSLILFLTTVAFTVNYDIPDIYEYFSLSVFALYLVSIPSYLFLINFFKSEKYGVVFPLIIIIVVLFIRIGANYTKADKSNNFLVEDYTRSILGVKEKNAIIFSNKWDYFISPAYYLQLVEKYNKDLIVINARSITLPWYQAELKKRYNFDLNAGIDISKYDIYLTPEVYSDEFDRDFINNVFPNRKLIPDVLVFRLVNDDKYYPASDPDFVMRIPKSEGIFTKHIVNLAGSMIANRIRYEAQFQKIDRAKIYYSKLLEDFPGYPIPADVNQLFIK